MTKLCKLVTLPGYILVAIWSMWADVATSEYLVLLLLIMFIDLASWYRAKYLGK